MPTPSAPGFDVADLPPMSPERRVKLRALVERYASDDAREDLDFEKWGEACPPWDVLSLLDECHGRRFDPDLVAEVERLRALLDETIDLAMRFDNDGAQPGERKRVMDIKQEAGLP